MAARRNAGKMHSCEGIGDEMDDPQLNAKIDEMHGIFVAYGWIIIQSSRSKYAELHSHEERDDLDDEVERSDVILHREFHSWVTQNLDAWVKWHFSHQLNNDSGIFQFHTSRNHGRASTIWDLMQFVIRQSKGSYGLVHTRNEEVERKKGDKGVFKVWRILDGKITEHSDDLFPLDGCENAFGQLNEVISDRPS